MKLLDENEFHVVRKGKACTMNGPVEVDQLTRMLEKKESDVFWLQPLKGKIEDQVAAVRINGCMYALSLRLEKAVFRHFRLSRDFCNIEYLEDGTPKLRIPARLLREKQRTSTRHSTMVREKNGIGLSGRKRKKLCKNTPVLNAENIIALVKTHVVPDPSVAMSFSPQSLQEHLHDIFKSVHPSMSLQSNITCDAIITPTGPERDTGSQTTACLV